MIVKELEELLAMLPNDMAVHISTETLGAVHIDLVDKQPLRRLHRIYDQILQPVHVDGRHPPALILRATKSAPRWYEMFGDQVDYRLAGHWPNAAYELDAVNC